MKFKKKSNKSPLSDKIADALSVKPRADIEDDEVFGSKPHTLSRDDFSSTEDEDDTAISDFRRRNVNLLSEISKKYEGQVVSRKDLEESEDNSSEEGHSEANGLSHTSDNVLPLKQLQNRDLPKNNLLKANLSDSDSQDSDLSDGFESDDYSITRFEEQDKDDASERSEDVDDDIDNVQGGYDISQLDELMKEDFEHVRKQNVSEEVKQGNCVRNQLLLWEGLLEMRIHLQRCINTANQMPMSDTFKGLKVDKKFSEECAKAKINVTNVLDNHKCDIVSDTASSLNLLLKDTLQEVKQTIKIIIQILLVSYLIFVSMLNCILAIFAYLYISNVAVSSTICKGYYNFSYYLKPRNYFRLLSLQSILLKKYPETQSISSDKVENKPNNKANLDKVESDEEIPSDTDNEEIPSDTEEEDNNKDQNKSLKSNTTDNKVLIKKRKLEDYGKELEKTHKALKTFRDSTIQKWNDKTRIATTSIKNTPTNTILQQISYILTDKNKLVKRTQLKRSEYEIVGHKNQSNEDMSKDHNVTDSNPVSKDRKDNDEYIPDIFDDSDFYHQLLRELIECKSADISDPVQLSRQWIALQQMRSKMKRKVDTKATKGRKIKYVVHNQLVNFMAPEKSISWNEESKNELYSSLFGKVFEQNSIGLNVNLDSSLKIIN